MEQDLRWCLTYNKLPSYKWIVNSNEEIFAVIRNMIAQKPPQLPFDESSDIESSLQIIAIDRVAMPEWREVYSWSRNLWSWKNLLDDYNLENKPTEQSKGS
jgi:hypothetical protein